MCSFHNITWISHHRIKLWNNLYVGLCSDEIYEIRSFLLLTGPWSGYWRYFFVWYVIKVSTRRVNHQWNASRNSSVRICSSISTGHRLISNLFLRHPTTKRYKSIGREREHIHSQLEMKLIRFYQSEKKLLLKKCTFWFPFN